MVTRMSVSNNDLLKEIRIMVTRFDKITERLDKLERKLDTDVLDINDKITQVHTSLVNDMTEVKK